MTIAQHHYPFSAVIGQDKLKQALILSVIEPHLGGVLVSGPRGIGKTTLARGLGELTTTQNGLVTLPLGATEEKLVGSLDIEKVLADGEVAFSPGILFRAHQGILYVDEVNLLADHLVDLLLDVAASGVNHVERDGISHQHAARFVLIGTMNPDEGELRPQLLDRFGLFVDMHERLTPQQRVDAVNRRVQFDQDPEEFIETFENEQQRLKDKIQTAQSNLQQVVLAADQQLYIAELCSQAQVEGLRADIALQRAAKAQAAWLGAQTVTHAHIDSVAEFVLAHRRNAPHPGNPSPDTPPPTNTPPKNTPPSSDPTGNGGNATEKPSRRPSDSFKNEQDWGQMSSGHSESQENVGQSNSVETSAMQILNEQDGSALFNQRSKDNTLAFLTSDDLTNKKSGKQKSSKAINKTGSQLSKTDRIAWFPTITDTLNLKQLNEEGPKLQHLHHVRAEQKQNSLHVILLDSSGSTQNNQSLGLAKGMVSQLINKFYLNREDVALIQFGNDEVNVVIQPKRAPKYIDKHLNQIHVGGGTPLRQAVLAAKDLFKKSKLKPPQQLNFLYLFTDGRVQDSMADLHLDANITVIDTELNRLRLARCKKIASTLGAHYIHIEDMPDLSNKEQSKRTSNS